MTTLPPLKKKSLLASGTLNAHPEAVKAELFQMEFFDPHDRAQVKYEMLRAQVLDGESVTAVCRDFGFSRQSFYQIRDAFHEQGLRAFLPEKKGRKGPTKLKGELLQYVLKEKKENPQIDAGRLASRIAERFGVEMHRTTVLRGMKKKLRGAGPRPSARRGSPS